MRRRVLGVDYPGYFPVGDTKALASLLRRLEREPRFSARLGKALTRRATLFRPAREIASWRRLLADLGRQDSSERREPGRLTGRAVYGKD